MIRASPTSTTSFCLPAVAGPHLCVAKRRIQTDSDSRMHQPSPRPSDTQRGDNIALHLLEPCACGSIPLSALRTSTIPTAMPANLTDEASPSTHGRGCGQRRRQIWKRH